MELKPNEIKYLRLELRVNQYELAEATGIKRWKIQLLESGHIEPTEDELTALGRVLLGRKH